MYDPIAVADLTPLLPLLNIFEYFSTLGIPSNRTPKTVYGSINYIKKISSLLDSFKTNSNGILGYLLWRILYTFDPYTQRNVMSLAGVIPNYNNDDAYVCYKITDQIFPLLVDRFFIYNHNMTGK